MIPSYSYEFIDAIRSGSETEDYYEGFSRAGVIRLCLANFTDSPAEPGACMVCGISVSAENKVSLMSIFDSGIGSSVKDFTSVFGTDPSVYSMTEYNDGPRTLQYRFSNGLTEDQRIPVLAEADEKELAELMIAHTAADGDTIADLSLYYFRLRN